MGEPLGTGEDETVDRLMELAEYTARAEGITVQEAVDRIVAMMAAD